MSDDLEQAKDRARLAFREAREELLSAERRRYPEEEIERARLAVQSAADEFVRAWRAWHDPVEE